MDAVEEDKKYLAEIEKVNKKYNRAITPVPVWRFSQDGNDFRLQIQLQVARMKDETLEK